MKITLSTIMRDGEPYVEYACRSTFPYADKIVIVDTGSVDNTPDIIRQVAKDYDVELILLFTEWKGYGPAREIAMSHISDGWLWKIGHDEIWFERSAKCLRQNLNAFWHVPKIHYLYPTEYTMEGSHITRQGNMNARSQFYRILNDRYWYTWGGMTTNDDLSRVDKATKQQLFLGPLCGDVNTINKDPRFTSFIIPGDSTGIYPPEKPDSIHFAKCSNERIQWKTKSYRQIVSDWPEEGMADPATQIPYHGPEWPKVLKGAKFLEDELTAVGVDLTDIQWV